MATVKLDAGPECLSVAIRDAKLDLVWDGVVDHEFPIDLSAGPYAAEVTNGRRNWTVSLEVDESTDEIDLSSPETVERPDGVFQRPWFVPPSATIEAASAAELASLAIPDLSAVSAAGSKAVVTTRDGQAFVVVDPENQTVTRLQPAWPVELAAIDDDGGHAVLQGSGDRIAVYDVRSPVSPKRRRIGRRRISPLPRSSAIESSEGIEVVYWVPPVSIENASALREPTTLSLWTRAADSRWTLNTAPSLDDLSQVVDAHRFLRVSRRERGTWIVSLPRQIKTIEIPKDPTGIPAVRILDADPRANLMHDLLAKRDLRSAATVATSRLRGKFQEPIGAAEGALAIVRVLGEIPEGERPPIEWFENLAERFEWLPDGLIAYAWFGIATGSIVHERALQAFLAAAERGVPATTDGIVLLRDGLELALEGASDGAPRDVLARVRGWLKLADRNSRRTLLRNSGGAVLRGQRPQSAKSSRLHVGASLYSFEGLVETESSFSLNL